MLEQKEDKKEDKIVIISHDYDGCFEIMTADTLREELSGERKILWEPWIKIGANIEKLFQSLRDQHNTFLDNITKNATKVCVYVGSNRQSYDLDQLGQEVNKNGSVFTALENLCKTRHTDAQPWIFEPLLLADPKLIDGKKPYARARGVAYKSIKDNAKRHLDVDTNDKFELEHSKSLILLHQIWDAYRQNPSATRLEFHFIDDRDDLIRDILKKLKPENLPPNLSLVVSKFDYTQVMQNLVNEDRFELPLENSGKRYCSDRIEAPAPSIIEKFLEKHPYLASKGLFPTPDSLVIDHPDRTKSVPFECNLANSSLKMNFQYDQNGNPDLS